jgi:hypothetical protein
VEVKGEKEGFTTLLLSKQRQRTEGGLPANEGRFVVTLSLLVLKGG